MPSIGDPPEPRDPRVLFALIVPVSLLLWLVIHLVAGRWPRLERLLQALLGAAGGLFSLMAMSTLSAAPVAHSAVSGLVAAAAGVLCTMIGPTKVLEMVVGALDLWV